MQNLSRCREKVEGWTGRRRNYKCVFCKAKFQHDGGQLPEKARVCGPCRGGNPVAFEQFDRVMKERR